jgi:hypothetical protein
MSYPAIPDMRMPYHRDGCVVGIGGTSGTVATIFAGGIARYVSGSDLIELNDADNAALGTAIPIPAVAGPVGASGVGVWVFFPELREVTAHYMGLDVLGSALISTGALLLTVQGSNDTTNGVDGTWETASLGNGQGVGYAQLDGFRAYIKAISLTGGKRAIRFALQANVNGLNLVLLHLYGRKAAGQTPDDIIFIDHDTTPGVEYAAAEDFGDRPLGTTVVRQFRVKNASTTKTANTINIQANDSDFTISTDGTTWVVTINIASLAALAESATMYIRNTTPAPGSLLGPRFAEVVAIVGSWT